ncbi:MAG: hypothetical protein JJ956_05765 [Pseudomonadales bacterium]|nr:hypothetical protein [Pseudomonadales bacterium]
MKSRKALLVLGMHRSGTSLLTGLIANGGFSIGKSVMAPAEDNPKGFFENQRIVDFNERLLNSFGLGWSSWQTLPDRWFISLDPEVSKEATDLLEEEFGDSSEICVKDPRICRLLPFWRSVLTGLGFEVVVVFTTRQSDEVSSSLQARDGMGKARADALWLRYNLDAMQSVEETKGIHISYEAVLEDPYAALSKVSALTGVDLKAPEEGFVDHTLKHHESATIPAWAALVSESCRRFPEKPDPVIERLVFPLVADLAEQEYRALSQPLEGTSPEASGVKEAALFNQAEEAKRHAISLSTELETGRKYIISLSTELETGRKYIADLEREHQVKDALIEEQESALQQSKKQQEYSSAQSESYAQTLKDSVEEAQKYIQSLEETLNRKESELVEASKAFESDKAQREEYTQSLVVEVNKKESELVDAHAELRQLHQDLENVRNSLMEKSDQLEVELQRFKLQRKMIDMFKREDDV